MSSRQNFAHIRKVHDTLWLFPSRTRRLLDRQEKGLARKGQPQTPVEVDLSQVPELKFAAYVPHQVGIFTRVFVPPNGVHGG